MIMSKGAAEAGAEAGKVGELGAGWEASEMERPEEGGRHSPTEERLGPRERADLGREAPTDQLGEVAQVGEHGGRHKRLRAASPVIAEVQRRWVAPLASPHRPSEKGHGEAAREGVDLAVGNWVRRRHLGRYVKALAEIAVEAGLWLTAKVVGQAEGWRFVSHVIFRRALWSKAGETGEEDVRVELEHRQASLQAGQLGSRSEEGRSEPVVPHRVVQLQRPVEGEAHPRDPFLPALPECPLVECHYRQPSHDALHPRYGVYRRPQHPPMVVIGLRQ